MKLPGGAFEPFHVWFGHTNAIAAARLDWMLGTMSLFKVCIQHITFNFQKLQSLCISNFCLHFDFWIFEFPCFQVAQSFTISFFQQSLLVKVGELSAPNLHLSKKNFLSSAICAENGDWLTIKFKLSAWMTVRNVVSTSEIVRKIFETKCKCNLKTSQMLKKNQSPQSLHGWQVNFIELWWLNKQWVAFQKPQFFFVKSQRCNWFVWWNVCNFQQIWEHCLVPQLAACELLQKVLNC